jgi:C-terminal processing protease CtpA/Prc
MLSDMSLTITHQARKALEDVERSHAQLVAERKAAQELANKFEKRYNDLQARLDEAGHTSSEAEAIRMRIEEELQKERDQHAADLDERDFAMNQTQQTYQRQCAMPSLVLKLFNTNPINRETHRVDLRWENRDFGLLQY